MMKLINWFVDWAYCSSHLKGGHPDYLIAVVEEVGQNIKDRCFWKDEFLAGKQRELVILNTSFRSHICYSFIAYLQVLNAELVSIHINGREEDGLHLVVSQLIRGEVGSNQHLSKEDEWMS